MYGLYVFFFFFQAEDGIRDKLVTGVQTCALPIAFAAESSFIEPEIVKADAATLNRLLASEPRLTMYRFYLEDIKRRARHTLSDSEEKILADAGPLSHTPSAVYTILS